jgi:predicted RNase H-like nuclease (RuvC/YqgF family)
MTSHPLMRPTCFPSGLLGVGLLTCLVSILCAVAGCKPDESPFREENEQLRKQFTKQDSMIISLQDGNKVMQQQINLLNQELREARQETERERAERKSLAAKLESVSAENRQLTTEAGRLAARKAEVAQTLRVGDTGGQSEEFGYPLQVVYKAVEEALSKNGYTVQLSVRMDQKGVYVTDRKTSATASLELPGFRNQYLVSMQHLPSKGTRLSVKADFEKLAQGNRVLSASAEETAEIERRLIVEVGKALAKPGKI